MTDITIGTNDGSILAPEDSNAGSGSLSDVTIGDNNRSEERRVGKGRTVTSNKGAIVADGQGTMTDITIGTNDGSILAPEDSNAGSGSLSDVTIGDNNGTVSIGSMSGAKVTAM